MTGFLGAGKSTLINRILSEFSHLRFGLIVNEFGDVGLESQIIEASEDEIFELSNGCMCCVVRTDMKDAVHSLVEKAGFVDHILMEASGLSDPAPIAQTFLEDDLDGADDFTVTLGDQQEGMDAGPVDAIDPEARGARQREPNRVRG